MAMSIGRGGDPRTGVAPRIDRWSIIILVASNVLTIGIALYQQWPLALLLLPFWLQSVIIGGFTVLRILTLDRFSTAGFAINGRQPDTSPKTKRSVAGFFVMHFGIFHFVYLVVLLALVASANAPADDAPRRAMTQTDWLWIAAAGVAFLFTHAASFRRNRAADARGCPNIGTLMFLPYVRVVPMHVMVIVGLAMSQVAHAVLLFGALKTVADVLMHVIEHRLLGRVPAGESTRA